MGFDIISGEPRLIPKIPFTDQPIIGFMHGFRFLVLAIGVYGIGEMLWTINTSRDGASMSNVDVSAKSIFAAIKDFKKAQKTKPIILMSYYNMIFQYNENKFLEKCKNVKVDGLIVVDLPYPENKKFAAKCKKKGINFIQLVSPTTSAVRLKKIIKDSHDMIYYISMLSTTGGKLKVSPKKILERYSKIKNQNKSKNVVIGFGITEKTINSLGKFISLMIPIMTISNDLLL